MSTTSIEPAALYVLSVLLQVIKIRLGTQFLNTTYDNSNAAGDLFGLYEMKQKT